MQMQLRLNSAQIRRVVKPDPDIRNYSLDRFPASVLFAHSYKQRAALLGAVLLLDRRGAHQEQPGEGSRAPIVSDKRDLSLHTLFKLNFGGQTEFAANPVWLSVTAGSMNRR
ncbi:MAG: hypothetical protein AAGF54_04875 [Pseudomonadota bacterium]